MKFSLTPPVKLLAASFFLLLLASCAPLTGQPELIIDGLIFRNQTGATVHNVQVRVKKTSAFAECSPVLVGSECTTTFKASPYRGNAITISWEQDGRTNKTDEFYASPPDPIIPGKPARVLITISRTGTAGASLIQ